MIEPVRDGFWVGLPILYADGLGEGTLCALTAPGHSAGRVLRVNRLDPNEQPLEVLWIFDPSWDNTEQERYCSTRAEAAAASYWADEEWSADAWGSQWKTQSPMFWRDAYRYCR